MSTGSSDKNPNEPIELPVIAPFESQLGKAAASRKNSTRTHAHTHTHTVHVYKQRRCTRQCHEFLKKNKKKNTVFGLPGLPEEIWTQITQTRW